MRRLEDGSPRTETAEVMRHHLKALTADDLDGMAELEALRPKTRADCVGGIRPCPFVACKFNLTIEVNKASGNIKHCETSGKDSCQLDIIDANPDGVSAAALAKILGIAHQAVTHHERESLKHLSDIKESIGTPGDGDPRGALEVQRAGGGGGYGLGYDYIMGKPGVKHME